MSGNPPLNESTMRTMCILATQLHAATASLEADIKNDVGDVKMTKQIVKRYRITESVIVATFADIFGNHTDLCCVSEMPWARSMHEDSISLIVNVLYTVADPLSSALALLGRSTSAASSTYSSFAGRDFEHEALDGRDAMSHDESFQAWRALLALSGILAHVKVATHPVQLGIDADKLVALLWKLRRLHDESCTHNALLEAATSLMLCIFRCSRVHKMPPTFSTKSVARIVQMISQESDVKDKLSRLIDVRLCAACHWLFEAEEKLNVAENGACFVKHGMIESLAKIAAAGIDAPSSSEMLECLPRAIAAWHSLLGFSDAMERSVAAKAADTIKRILDMMHKSSSEDSMSNDAERLVVETLIMLKKMVQLSSNDAKVIKSTDQIWQLCTDDRASPRVREHAARCFP